MRKFIILFVFFATNSVACEKIWNDYFESFSRTFSRTTISEKNFKELSTYKLNPEFFMDLGKYPVSMYSQSDKENSNVIFNGEVSRHYFIRFVNEMILANGKFNGVKQDYSDKGAKYSFSVERNSKGITIYESILMPEPEDMTSEVSCSYKFSNSETNSVKLTDVVCAG